MTFNCPLCFSEEFTEYFHDSKFERHHFRCSECDLVFVDRTKLLDISEEGKRYSNHENHIRTPGYEKFLRRLVDPITSRLEANARGLDYGEGPYPMMREIFKEEGFVNVTGHDPIFNPADFSKLESLDFITSSEAVEHMNEPRKEWDRFFQLLGKNGLLAISTGIFYDDIDYTKWHYITDPTHINIYSLKTLKWLGDNYQYEVVEQEKDKIIFQKG